MLGAERVLAVRAGRISLAGEEAVGGHTILKHINQSESALRARLIAEPGIPAATSWTSVRVAEDVISETMRTNKFAIENWAKAGGKGRLILNHLGSSPIGSGVVRATGRLEAMSNARIVLARTQIAGRIILYLRRIHSPDSYSEESVGYVFF
ncbi:MAG: RNase A-like domain-containing protein [Janthinobacterium lividum]